MFAVPGWSISPALLKIQTEPNISKAASAHNPDNPTGTDRKKSRKRKRGHGSNSAVEVTHENLGDLWRKHIEKKVSDQYPPKEEGKQGKQTNEGKDDALGEIEHVDGGSFEGFSEKEKEITSTIEENAPPKKKKKKKKKREKDNSASTVQINGREDAAGTSPHHLKEQAEVEDGKSKYEQRKAKALKKREQRALLQANGTLPPVRPDAVSSRPTNTAPADPTQTTKPSGSSNAPVTLHQPTVTPSTKLTKAKQPPEPLIASYATQDPASSVPFTKLTPLQQRMAAKLTSARFRHLNQTLYTSPSDQAMRLFADFPQNYTSYHAGFRAQVAVWPQNPVDGFIEDIRARSRVSVPSQKKLWREQKKGKKPKGGNGDATASTIAIQEGEKLDPLPRSPNGICTIADLGCGDATLAGSLSPSAKSLRLKLLSFDLAKGDTRYAHLISVADISSLSAAGVKDGAVDVAICCLSLMGTNWVDIVDECARVVRGGGEVWVAEIKSRFARPGVMKKKPGGGIGRKKGTGKGKNAAGEEDEEAVEDVEDAEDKEIKEGKDETDVGAFVEVFGKRGLVLKGEPDMRNKMFVRMRFARSLGGRVEKGDGSTGRGGMYAKTRFVDDDDVEEVDEGKVLKPCVYKTR